MSYSVVSISNKKPEAWFYLFDQYIQSLGNFGLEPKIYQPSYWGGLATKPKFLYYLIKNKVIDTEYTIFTDCWDFIFCYHPDEMFNRYKEMNTDIVISSERNCFPADLMDKFDAVNPPTEYKYLNSGCIVGKTDAILSCLEAMDLANLPDDHFDGEKNVHPNDQFEWMKIWVNPPCEIKLDYEQQLSLTLHNANIEELDFSKEHIRNIPTNSYPCALHFNGTSKDNLSIRNPILNHLNKENRNLHEMYFNKD